MIYFHNLHDYLQSVENNQTIVEIDIFDDLNWKEVKITEKCCILEINSFSKALLNELQIFKWL